MLGKQGGGADMRALGHTFIALLLAGAALATASVARADDDDDDQKSPGMAQESEGVETENIFGYTLGTDTGEKGEKELTFTLDGRLGKSGSTYEAVTGEVEFEYSLTDNLKFSLGAAVSDFNIRNVAGFEDTNAGGLSGAFFELKYRFLDYRTSPFGLSLSIEPEWSRLDELSGEASTAYGVEFRLAADKELIKDTLYAAINVAYIPEWEREELEVEINGNDVNLGNFWSSSSGLEISGAVTAQVVKDVFLGGELRYLSAFSGNFLNSQEGWGLFLGPTLYTQVTESLYIKATWSFQLTGSSPESVNAALDLVNFERQQGMLQVGFTF